MTELTDVMMNLQRFSWPDYLVLVLMLCLCILIGIYFGVNQKSNTENEYLMGGRTMSIFPVAMSLVARYNIVCIQNYINRILMKKKNVSFFNLKFYIWNHVARSANRNLFVWHSIFVCYRWRHCYGTCNGICFPARISRPQYNIDLWGKTKISFV